MANLMKVRFDGIYILYSISMNFLISYNLYKANVCIFIFSAAFEFMVKTEKGWSCKECEFMSAAKSENNSRQNLRRHVLVKHCQQEDVFCQYCNKVFRNLPSCEKHISGCVKRYNL